MRVFVTGGTGFVGPAIVRAFAAAGHDVTVLVHKSAGSLEGEKGVRIVRGDATKPESFRSDLAGHDAVAHLVAIRRGPPELFERLHTGAAKAVVDASVAEGVKRFIYMSAHGVKPDGVPYQRTKWESEQYVKGSGLEWTIFRPTFVTGPSEPGSPGADQEFAGVARWAPMMPAFGGGRFELQPVAKRDVALAFLRALERPVAVGKTYLLAGPDVVTFREYLRLVLRHSGRRRPIVPVPRWAILPVASALGGFSWFPASHDELVMMMEGHAGDPSESVRDLGLDLTPFEEALAEALAAPWELEDKRR